jgi:hypothetical protein
MFSKSKTNTKVNRSYLLLPTERSHNKEHSFEISKPHNIPFKKFNQALKVKVFKVMQTSKPNLLVKEHSCEISKL